MGFLPGSTVHFIPEFDFCQAVVDAYPENSQKKPKYCTIVF